jgi:nitrate reductase (cytochrome), electron transfer subunit
MTPPAERPTPRPTSGKLATIAACAALTLGLSGYFMGLIQTGRSAERIKDLASLSHSLPVAHEPIAPTAPKYRELATRTLQKNHGWNSRLTDLAPPAAPQDGPRALTDAEFTHFLGQRAARRAFDGAPPTVPHPVDQSHAASCLSCHGQPTRVGSIMVPQISHPPYTSCLQCHAPSGGPGATWAALPPALSTPAVDNSFLGRDAAGAGSRAYAGAPPMLPHSTWMRQNCMSCHGDGGSSAIKTTHPTRQNCLQCHALNAELEHAPSSHPLLDLSRLPPPVAPLP